ncbi:MAG: hypothetical protein WC380_00245 [Pedobacter sp.]|jgi:hypothetical protein
MGKKIRKSQIKLHKKLKKFFERERKVLYIKVSNEFLKDPASNIIIAEMLNPKNKEKLKNAIRNISKVEIGLDRDDFIKNLKTARVTYTYPKYGNL